MFGPSKGELLLLLHVPLAVALFLALPLLLSWRKFFYLVMAALAIAVYFALAISLLASFAGALMLMSIGWASVAFIATARYLSAASGEGTGKLDLPSNNSDDFPPTRPLDRGPYGLCPNCRAEIPLTSAECTKCGARFGNESAWKVEHY